MYSSIQTGTATGMITMDQYLQDLLARGLISKHDARAKAVNKETFA
jgi:twitching motility protein PilT